ncbi:YidC/Oxa1 family membrane protein insertase [Mucilaginibacter gracilis]|uniref:Membrane protein insertase YidC n=1 Tax=Mucilaginibacter gracilis TaxID=423350 RepID=A0A495J4I3_9SPHI|nr:membrane protein insertase YidC [Mucilaginibacter gracilis]RKR83896.1 YidC/Oxa1 family membrane protein insertase [Mucilaginibacter gracilis]
MDKNTYTGLFLIMLILFGSFYLMKPSEAELKKAQIAAHADSLKRAGIKTAAVVPQADSVKKPKVVDSALLKTAFGAATVGDDKLVTVQNKELLVKVSTLGGRVQSVELKRFKTFDGKPLILFDGANNHFGLNFIAGNKKINTNDLYFKPSSAGLNSAGADSTITFRLNYSATQYIDYVYTLSPLGYKLGLTIKEVGLDNVVADNKTIDINWQSSMLKTEKDMGMERQYSTVTYKNTEDDVYNLSVTGDEAKTIADKKVQWVSFKQHFFSNVLIYKDGFTKSDLRVSLDTSNKTEVKQMLASLQIPANTAGVYPMEFYFGPNEFKTLKAQGYNLDKQIDLGWVLFKYINRYVVLVVFDFLKQFGWNYGIVILILTILLKLVLSPLTYKSYLSMAKMRVLKPEMDEIKAKVGEDNPTLLQQEYMKLYKKAGVNPLGGCLPMVLQLPIVFAFLRFFPALFELRGQSFLWMKDLSTYDDLIKFGTTIPLLGDHLSLMCLLMTISTFIYTYFNNQISGASGQMKYIGYITPVIFIFVLNKYPAGLNYYYFLANMLTFAQQYLIRLMVDDKKIHAQIQDNKKKPEDKTKKKGGFAAKMEELMRQQQQVKQAPASTTPPKKLK